MKIPINIELRSGKVDFLMDLDPTCLADQATATAFNAWHGCEPEVVNLLMRVLRTGDLVIDGGANVGFFTMLMAKLVGPTGRVIAFEPAEQNIHKLATNMHLNKFENVTIVSNPLWSKLEQVTFHHAQQSGYSGLARSPMTVSSQSKQAVTLDAYLGENGDSPRLLKLDIEGAELQALIGAAKHLWGTYVVCEACEENLQRFGDTLHELREAASWFHYDTFILRGDGGFPTYLPPEVEIRTKRANLNVLFATTEMVVKAWPYEEIPTTGY